jgi:hypothetical protein
LFPHLDERQRRLLMGAEACVLGHGGVAAVARAAGGETVTAELDESIYPKGIKITDREMADLETQHLTRHDFPGEWNYSVSSAKFAQQK